MWYILLAYNTNTNLYILLTNILTIYITYILTSNTNYIYYLVILTRKLADYNILYNRILDVLTNYLTGRILCH